MVVFDEWGRTIARDPLSGQIKVELADIIRWNERNSPRSQQKALGPSELGTPCDRQLAYRIAGTPTINMTNDPWPAIVGTSVHAWLETAINRYQEVNGDHGWLTELRVHPDELVSGSSDLFHTKTGTVVDHKTAGADVMKKIRRGEDPPEGYVTQVHLYGLGHKRAGRVVRNVALVFYPRSGWLDDVYVWSAPYDEAKARAALDRMYAIGYQLIEHDIENNPHRFQLIPATPGDACVWCDHFNRDLDPDTGASDKGCSGRQ